MPSVTFTPNLQRHVICPTLVVSGDNVRSVLDQVFAANPALRSYVVDDQGELRKHVIVFVDNEIIMERRGLTDAVQTDSEIFVMQALSGG
jgi:hypothetical protein